jgi:hypothetical protein
MFAALQHQSPQLNLAKAVREAITSGPGLDQLSHLASFESRKGELQQQNIIECIAATDLGMFGKRMSN